MGAVNRPHPARADEREDLVAAGEQLSVHGSRQQDAGVVLDGGDVGRRDGGDVGRRGMGDPCVAFVLSKVPGSTGQLWGERHGPFRLVEVGPGRLGHAERR